MRFKLFSLIFIIATSFSYSQITVRDTILEQKLDQVVVTAQYNPQSIRKSVHNVTVINSEQIKQQAANNLSDLLNFNLNLTVIPNSQTGKSTISFFGLDSQYFNILIDNVPMVSDSGLGNNIDLTQINLDDIERIEIVEGAMGVEYGANAVSGVINIITKKSADENWNITATLQEETISDEYALFSGGRHIQSVTASHNINDNWFASVGVNRNHFLGFFNDKKGKKYYQNDGLRGYDWLPKTQFTSNALVNHDIGNHKFFYKFEYFNEEILYHDATVRANIDTQTQTSNPSATDRIFTTNRFYNHVNGSGTFTNDLRYNMSVSYQQQERNLNEFNYFILTGQKTNESDDVYQSSKVFFSKGSLSNLLKKEKFKGQIGYEVIIQEGFDTEASGGITSLPKSQELNNYAIYASAEIETDKSLSFRPGVRYTYNSKFDSKITAALTARKLFENKIEVRANLGTSYRTPNFQELYYYFVDSNHDVRGNENLNPEEGISAFLNFKKRSWINDLRIEYALKLNYLSVNDKIELAIVNNFPLQYKYINIDTYKLWGVTYTNGVQSDNWNFNLGATVNGISRELSNEVNANNEFLYNLQLNTSATYYIEKWETAISVLFKYNGKQKNYVTSDLDDLGNSTFTQITTDGYGWLDASLKKSFLNNKLETTLGARNILDVTKVDSNSADPESSHDANSSLLLGYGRSYYLKLLYKLNF